MPSIPAAEGYKPEAGAPDKDEVEITPEMIEAGGDALWDWMLDNGFAESFTQTLARESVEEILRAALRQSSRAA